MKNKKFYLKCDICTHVIDGFAAWFGAGQRCSDCGSSQVSIFYNKDITLLKSAIHHNESLYRGIWRYFDFLPVSCKDSIVSCGEGDIAISRWKFLEDFAQEKYNIRCRVYAHRYDNNYATGTFKDLAATVVASVLKENNVKDYVVATTGNIGVAYARYLADAKIKLYAFIPKNSSRIQEAEISCFGQKVYRVDGDYQKAKELAREFAQKNNILLAAGNFDPMRIEAKKTMLYEWLRCMPEFPTVYFQGLSGGTGPLGIAKAGKELSAAGLFKRIPRFILVQTNKCSPMADAWTKAKIKKFPLGWEKNYPIYHNPETSIPTLATGYPKTYPAISKLVYEGGGEIISFDEEKAVDVARLVAFESAVRIGPAAAIPAGGFLKSLNENYIKQGDVVLLNIGEGIRRAPEFMKKLTYNTNSVRSLNECSLFSREEIKEKLWASLEKI